MSTRTRSWIRRSAPVRASVETGVRLRRRSLIRLGMSSPPGPQSASSPPAKTRPPLADRPRRTPHHKEKAQSRKRFSNAVGHRSRFVGKLLYRDAAELGAVVAIGWTAD